MRFSCILAAAAAALLTGVNGQLKPVGTPHLNPLIPQGEMPTPENMFPGIGPAIVSTIPDGVVSPRHTATFVAPDYPSRVADVLLAGTHKVKDGSEEEEDEDEKEDEKLARLLVLPIPTTFVVSKSNLGSGPRIRPPPVPTFSLD